MAEKIMEVEKLRVRFYTYEGIVKAIDNVDLDVIKGETLGIVGETGSGKSVTTYAMMNMVPPPGRIVRGKVLFYDEGKKIDLVKMSDEQLRRIRGSKISRIFQEPKSALNPTVKVGDQVAEALLIHRKEEMIKKWLEKAEIEVNKVIPEEKFPQKLKGEIKKFFLKLEMKIMKRSLEKKDLTVKLVSRLPIIKRLYWNPVKDGARKEVERILRLMGIPDPSRVYNMYPHELSGGMQQRIVIAMALACNPQLLIADEPTTNLDVTVEAQILELMKELKTKIGSTLIYITHDMGVIAEMSDRVAVMYAGNICVVADVYTIFKKPLHPYTKGLLEAIPMPGRELKAIPGTVPNLINPPSGCRFHPRCPKAMEKCKKYKPKLVEIEPGHKVACFLYSDEMIEDGDE